VGLIAAALESRGIATVAIQLLREVAERVRPPRSLWVPFPHGFPLGKPGDATLQRDVIEAALRLLEDRSLTPPVLADFVRKEGSSR